MNDKLYIPKKLNVGFQNRTGTYNGKLAYVIYWDDKGKLRKEGSWTSWCDKQIPAQVLDNEPTEGFVLNRQVGGARSGHSWDARLEKVRVYDPRGFEFEITIPNLLYILQECTSVKGKGLDGKFVYSWAGPVLVLLPVDSAEYKSSSAFTDLQGKKIGKSEMVEGCVYMTKDSIKLVYLGRFNYTEFRSDTYSWYKKNDYILASGMKHIFYNLKSNKFEGHDGFTKLGTKETDIPVDNYAELVESYLKTRNGGVISEIIAEAKRVHCENMYSYSCHQNVFLIKSKGVFYKKIGDNQFNQMSFTWDKDANKFRVKEVYTLSLVNGGIVEKPIKSNEELIHQKDIDKLDLYQIKLKLSDEAQLRFGYCEE